MEISLLCPSPSSSSYSFAMWAFLAISSIFCSLYLLIMAFLLALVGTTVGAIFGGMVGVKSKSGFVHGATVGTVMGFIVFAEIFLASFGVWDWDFHHFPIGSFIYLIEIASNRLKEALMQGRFSPTTIHFHSQQPSQGDASHIMGNEDHKKSKHSKIRLTSENIVDTLWNGPSCSICLQDFDLGETVCSLPHCQHTFHLLCIRKWFVKQSSCPLCRTKLSRKSIATRREMQNASIRQNLLF